MQSESDILKQKFALEDALNEALHTGNTSNLEQLIADGIDVDLRFEDLRTALMEAAGAGDIHLVKLLVEAGADVNAEDDGNYCALLEAADCGCREVFDYLAPLTATEFRQEAEALLPKGLLRRQRRNSPAEEFVGNSDIDAVRQAIEEGIDVNGICSDGMTALHPAALWGHVALVKLLLEHGADVNSRSEDNGETPLMRAADGIGNPNRAHSEDDYVATIELLLKAGADVNAKTPNGWTALQNAASSESIRAVKLLLQAGADIDAENSALHSAALWGRVAIVKLLLEHGADVNSRSEYKGETPLIEAATGAKIVENWGIFGIKKTDDGHVATIELLLEAGADVNAKTHTGCTALEAAVNSGSTRSVKLLLQALADIKTKDFRENIALHSAAYRGRFAIVKLLLEHGADVNLHSEDDGKTPLMKAAEGAKPVQYSYIDGKKKADDDHVAAIELLLEAGADVNAKTSTGCTALKEAVNSGSTRAVKLLLQAGADANAKDFSEDSDRGITALHLAAYWSHAAIVKLLLEHGADVNSRSEDTGETPLMRAAEGGRPIEYYRKSKINDDQVATIELLLGAGADVNAKTSTGYTALNKAVNSGRIRAVKLLLQAGADINAINIKDLTGNTAISRRKKAKQREIVQILLEAAL